MRTWRYLDHLKHINDQFGRGSGDDVLAAVGAALARNVRTSDFVGRYGGEEFLVLLAATELEGAGQTAEIIRSAIADIKVPTVPQSVTISVGVAVLADHGNDAASLSQAADRALYAARSAGRDRVAVFGTKPGGVTRNLEVVTLTRIVDARTQTR